MTDVREKIKSIMGSAALTAACLALLAFFIINARTASDAVLTALSLAVKSVVPSVFPSMVLSGILVASGGGELIGNTLGKPLAKLMGTSPSASSAVILGALCGFPVGAVTASALYKRGELTKNEFELIIGVASLPSPAFVINAVGGNMLGNIRLGVFLYLLVLSVSISVGAIWNRVTQNKPIKSSNSQLNGEKIKITEITVNAISSSALSALRITAYIVFFSTLTATLTEIFIPQNAPAFISALIGGILEFSGGCAAASKLGLSLSLPLSALFLGFSGFGVHFQVISACPAGTAFKKYFLFSAIRAAVAFLVSLAVSTAFFGIY